MDINEHDIRTAFDSEGTLSTTTSRNGQVRWVIEISNTDLHWLELLTVYLEAHDYHPALRTMPRWKNPKWKTGYKLCIERKHEMARFLKDFPPLTAFKQQRCLEFALWFNRPHAQGWHWGKNKGVDLCHY